MPPSSSNRSSDRSRSPRSFAEERLEHHLLGNYLRNKTSASATHEVAALAADAGAQGVAHISKCGAYVKKFKNLSRDIMRHVKKMETTSKLFTPEPYFITLPILDPKTQATIYVQRPVLLPHEMISWLLAAQKCHLADLCQFTRDDNYLNIYHNDICEHFHLDRNATIPLGFHGDGAAFQKSHHRSSSTEVYSWNFIVDKDGKRFMFTNINKDFLLPNNQTTYTLLEVFNWSMIVMFHGFWPALRHDGTNWCTTDNYRRSKSGKLGFHGVLLQIRGDWMWYQAIFKMPTHTNQKFCFRCKCTKVDGDALNYKDTLVGMQFGQRPEGSLMIG
jgi:hypothetical protein